MARKAKDAMGATRAGRRSSRRPRPARRRADARGVQRAIHDAFNRSDLIGVGVLNLARNTIVTALAGVQDVGAELGGAAVAVARGAIRAAYRISGDLGSVAREAVRGTITAAKEIGGDVGGAANSAAQGAVKATGEVRGDVATVARRAVEGSIAAAREIGSDVGVVAKNAAAGAIEAADRIGLAAGRAVRTTLATTVAGVRSLVDDAQSRAPTRTADGPRARRAKDRPQPRTTRKGPKQAR
ncbi:MAG: hypothetical protein DMD91_08350 [Candidatus Rokuibacteriota bacterium]|nr:MAG: hypothetical protein DMD91_08350 [Candidatus Rokubacteria bacterium]